MSPGRTRVCFGTDVVGKSQLPSAYPLARRYAMADDLAEIAKEKPFWRRHGTLILFGAIIVIVPLSILLQSLEQTRKTVHKTISPVQEIIPHIDIAGISMYVIGTALIVLGLCWILGWFVTSTDLGGRLGDWVTATFLRRSALYTSLEEHEEAGRGDGKTVAPPFSPRPGLVELGGSYQPCVILAIREKSWTSVFVPILPAGTTGTVYIVEASRVRRLELDLDHFRTALQSPGHGSELWLDALA